MRPAVFGIAVALAALIGATDIANAQRGKAKEKEAPAAAAAATGGAATPEALSAAPALIANAQLPCTPTEARSAGKNAAGDMTEVACQQGMGYIITYDAKARKSVSDDCMTVAVKGGKCTLPGNADPIASLGALVTKGGGAGCTPEKGRFIGGNATMRLYEVACTSGSGFILQAKADGTATAGPCLALVGTENKCQLTTEEQNYAPIMKLAESGEKKCTIDKARYVFTGSNGDYYEYACTDKTGFMILAKDGVFQRQVPCLQAMNLNGGCTLTSLADAGLTADNALYTRLAKAAGFDCDVSSYIVFPGNTGREIVELACGNRTDGGVMVSGAGKAEIMNCGRAVADGMRCNLTKPETAFTPLTKQLAELGKTSCTVNGARALATSATESFVEVACADGNPGWVIRYPKGVNKPDSVVTCSDVARVAGGCQLPTNKRA